MLQKMNNSILSEVEKIISEKSFFCENRINSFF